MDAEVATESFRCLDENPCCTKNPNHEGFINFLDFCLTHLPEDVRKEEYLQYIKTVGNRVVKLTVSKQDGTFLYGSGMVVRIGPKLLVLTNYHVIGTQEDVNNCTIEFFYNSPDESIVVKSYGETLLACSDLQDRSALTFRPIPKEIEDMAMFDNSENIATLTIQHGDEQSTRCIGYVNNKDGRWLLMVARDNVNPGRLTSCQVTFQKKNSELQQTATFVGIHHVEEKVAHLELTDVPEFVQKAALRKWVTPWPMGNKEFVPVTISHPHGGPKMVTVGKTMAVESDGFVGKLYHTARTCPGSSGGLIITVGGDVSHYLGYTAEDGMHCGGEKADMFRGIPTETGNLNISLINNH